MSVKHLIGKTLKVTDLTTSTEYSYHDVIEGINFYISWLIKNNIGSHNTVAIYSTQNFECFCLLFALLELGVDITIIENRYEDLDELKVDTLLLHPSEIKSKPANTYTLIIPYIRSSSLSHFGSLVTDKESSIIVYTSGTTGKAKKIVHKLKSIVVPSRYMSKFYSANSRVLITSTINHLGVVSTTLMPSIIAGSHLFLTYGWCSEHSFYEDILEHNITIANIFPVGLQRYLVKHTMPNLSTIEKVITGGTKINNDFIRQVREAGADNVYAIYGATECLPPVSIFVNEQDEGNDFLCLGEPVEYCEVKISKSNAILVKGSNVCESIDNKLVTGYVNTGDKGYIKANTLYLLGRRKDLEFVRNANDQRISVYAMITYVRHNFWKKFLLEYFDDKLLLFTTPEYKHQIDDTIKTLYKKFYVYVDTVVVVKNLFSHNGLKQQLRKEDALEIINVDVNSVVHDNNVRQVNGD